MDLETALEISDHPNTHTHNEQVIARLTLAHGIRRVLSMCEVWLEREPDCAGVRAIRDELKGMS